MFILYKNADGRDDRVISSKQMCAYLYDGSNFIYSYIIYKYIFIYIYKYNI